MPPPSSQHDLTHRWVDKAIVRPFKAPILPNFVGGPELPDHEDFAPFRHHRHGHAVGGPEPNSGGLPQHLAGEYLYCGPLMPQFGHFMSECIHRILPGRRIAPAVPLLFSGVPRGQNALDLPFIRQALEFLGVSVDQVAVAHRAVRVDRLLLVPQASQLGKGARPRYLDVLDSYSPSRLDVLIPAGSTGETPADIYVSRSQMSSGLLLGESCFESWLQDVGYHILRPERATLFGQMDMYRRARRIVFAEGSSCHGVELLGRQLPSTAILNRRKIIVNDIRLVVQARSSSYASFLGNQYVGALPIGLGGRPLPHIGVAVLNVRDLVAFLASQGLADITDRLDISAYRHAARADFQRHVEWALSRSPGNTDAVRAAVPELEQALERTLAELG